MDLSKFKNELIEYMRNRYEYDWDLWEDNVAIETLRFLQTKIDQEKALSELVRISEEIGGYDND